MCLSHSHVLHVNYRMVNVNWLIVWQLEHNDKNQDGDDGSASNHWLQRAIHKAMPSDEDMKARRRFMNVKIAFMSIIIYFPAWNGFGSSVKNGKWQNFIPLTVSCRLRLNGWVWESQTCQKLSFMKINHFCFTTHPFNDGFLLANGRTASTMQPPSQNECIRCQTEKANTVHVFCLLSLLLVNANKLD